MPRERKSIDDHKLNGTRPEYVTPDSSVRPGRPHYPKNISADAKRTFKRWLAAMAEEEARRAPNPMDTCVPNIYPGTWEVINLPLSNRPVIIFRLGCEVSRYDRVAPKGCPPEVKKDFEQRLKATSPEAAEALREKQEQDNNRRLIQENGERVRQRAILMGY